jgi:putative transposase
LIWCPKYRLKVLAGEVAIRLLELLHEKAAELPLRIEQAEIMPDQVHLFVKAPPTLPPHYIVGQLKGYSSRILRQEFDQLRTRLPSLWTRSYYVETVGHISEQAIQQYIADQKSR